MTDTPRPSDETPTGDEPIERASAYEDTYPFAMGGSPYASPQAAPVPERQRRGRATFAASVVAASLLVGAGAGVGGAAAWNSFQGNGSGTSSSTASRTTSPVVDTSPAPAADGSVEQVAQAVLPSVVKIDVVGARRPAPARASSSPRTGRSSPTTTWSRSPVTAARSRSPSATAPAPRPASSAPTPRPTPPSSRPTGSAVSRRPRSASPAAWPWASPWWPSARRSAWTPR